MQPVIVEYNKRVFFGLLKSPKLVRETLVPFSVGRGATDKTIVVTLSLKGPKIEVPVSLKQYWCAMQDAMDIGSLPLDLTSTGVAKLDDLYWKHKGNPLTENDITPKRAQYARRGHYMS